MHADAMRYLIVSIFRGEEYLPERRLSDLDRFNTILDIAGGHVGDVSHVIEFNIAEAILRDVTEDILAEASDLIDAEPRHNAQDRADWIADHARKLKRES